MKGRFLENRAGLPWKAFFFLSKPRCQHPFPRTPSSATDGKGKYWLTLLCESCCRDQAREVRVVEQLDEKRGPFPMLQTNHGQGETRRTDEPVHPSRNSLPASVVRAVLIRRSGGLKCESATTPTSLCGTSSRQVVCRPAKRGSNGLLNACSRFFAVPVGVHTAFHLLAEKAWRSSSKTSVGSIALLCTIGCK